MVETYCSVFKGNDIIWRKIPGFDYEISNTGLVKSLAKTHTQTYSTGKVGSHTSQEKILNRRWDTKGYNTCILYKDGKSFPKKVHRLVAQAFIENPRNLPQINHINSIKDDNRVENLEWCDNSYNQKHSWLSGFRVNNHIGENNNKAKLKNKDIIKIRTAKMLGIKTKELCSIFGVNRHTINSIVRYRTWKHIKLLEL